MGWTVVIVAGVLAIPLLLMYVFQRGMIYMPVAELPPLGDVLPGAESVEIATDDGLTLGGWFLPPDRAGQPTVLVFNGNAINRAARAPLAERFHERGLGVLLFDYRGYGGNPGSPDERGLLADARAALRWASGRPEVDPARIVYFGESLGSGVAVALAAERAPAALLLRSPFTSLVDAARIHFPILPLGLLMKDRYASIDRIGRLHCPLLVIAGEADTIVPFALSRRLYEAANPPKRLLSYPGYDHNDPGLSRGELWTDDAVAFLREQIAP